MKMMVLQDCRLYIVASVLAQISDYNTLDQDEYLDFMTMQLGEMFR